MKKSIYRIIFLTVTEQMERYRNYCELLRLELEACRRRLHSYHFYLFASQGRKIRLKKRMLALQDELESKQCYI